MLGRWLRERKANCSSTSMAESETAAASSPLRADPLNVTLYTRFGCHLCDDALALLRRHGLSPREVDIDQDPQLRERYDTCVPVVEIDGRERFRGRVDELLLRRLIKAGPGR